LRPTGAVFKCILFLFWYFFNSSAWPTLFLTFVFADLLTLFWLKSGQYCYCCHRSLVYHYYFSIHCHQPSITNVVGQAHPASLSHDLVRPNCWQRNGV